jgi:hypothetical protein
MRIAFFDSTAEELNPQRKGQLFERLARRLVELSGYVDVRLRAKHTSLEYDLEARHNLSGRTLMGEAKAHDSNIRGQDLAAFVGKLLPRAASGPVDGLFISTSPFTAEARDYLDGLSDTTLDQFRLSLRTLVGEKIPQFLSTQGQCLSEATLRTRVSELYSLEALDTWFIGAERGDFLVATCGPNAIGAATHFALFDLNGGELSLDDSLLSHLQLQLADLKGLPLVSRAEDPGQTLPIQRLPSVVAGIGWFDYKFPVSPEYFIGRDNSLADINQVIESIHGGATSIRGIQITSRSGVGKSSVLLKMPTLVADDVFVTVDGRTLRVPSDLRLLVSELVERVNDQTGCTAHPPRSQDDLQGTLQVLGENLRQSAAVAIVQIDQFESVLALPSVFEAVLDLIATCTTRSLPIIWILARKNDVTVTFDEGSHIDLARLNDLSRSIGLEDFRPDESRLLLDQLRSELGWGLRDDLGESILTFSGGFPWLLKRLCAHVLSMHESGVSQRDLIQTGLRADDLFEEDLAGLSEQDKALLRTIAAHLPNTATELIRRLESETNPQQLTIKLNEFLGRKLLRLSGDVYDTYNDVFKTYLVTQRVPFQSRYVFRVAPGAAFALLDEIDRVGPTSLSSFQKRMGGNPIVVLNKLRELRLLGLIDPEAGRVALTPETQTAVESNTLGDLIRRLLRGNALVVRVLELLTNKGEVSLEEIAHELQRDMPHVSVTEATWLLYARQLVAWLHFASLVFVEGKHVRLREVPSDDLLRRREFTRGTFSSDVFMPSVRPNRVLELLLMLQERSIARSELLAHFGDRTTAGLLRDARVLGIATVDNQQVYLGRQGRALVERDGAITERDIAELALTKQNVQTMLDAASSERLDKEAQKSVLTQFGSANWTEKTWNWRLGLLRAWLVATGQAKSGRLGLEAT